MSNRKKIIVIFFGIVFFAITVLGYIILFNAPPFGFPVFDAGITGDQFTLMDIERHSTLPYPSSPYLNISESQMNQCSILKTACQELVENDQDSIRIQLNSSEFNYISLFLESLYPEGTDIDLIYYLGFYFDIVFSSG